VVAVDINKPRMSKQQFKISNMLCGDCDVTKRKCVDCFVLFKNIYSYYNSSFLFFFIIIHQTGKE
jgi:hypothetical protein